MSESAPLPTPEEAARLARDSAIEEIIRLRERVRREILRNAVMSPGRDVYVDITGISVSQSAFDYVKEELESRGWAVRRDSSPRNESYMVLSA